MIDILETMKQPLIPAIAGASIGALATLVAVKMQSSHLKKEAFKPHKDSILSYIHFCEIWLSNIISMHDDIVLEPKSSYHPRNSTRLVRKNQYDTVSTALNSALDLIKTDSNLNKNLAPLIEETRDNIMEVRNRLLVDHEHICRSEFIATLDKLKINKTLILNTLRKSKLVAI